MISDLWHNNVLRSDELYRCFLRTGEVRVPVRRAVRPSYDDVIVDPLVRPGLSVVTFTRGPRGQVLADFEGVSSEVEPPRDEIPD